MTPQNVLDVTTREEFRQWLSTHHASQSECWLVAKKGKQPPTDCVWYLDAVEEALCFGWIDTMHKTIDGRNLQKFTPRAARSVWSELNRERCRRLERLGQMTAAGRAVLPDMDPANFVIDFEIQQSFDQNPIAWANFQQFPALYRRVRIDAIQRDKRKDRPVFDRRLDRLITQSAANRMFGDWNDYGRLVVVPEM